MKKIVDFQFGIAYRYFGHGSEKFKGNMHLEGCTLQRTKSGMLLVRCYSRRWGFIIQCCDLYVIFLN